MGKRPPEAGRLVARRWAVVLGAMALAGTVALGAAGPARAGAPCCASRAGGVGLPAPRRPPEQLRRAAHDVVAGPEYRRGEPPLVERLLTWAGERIADLVDGVSGGGSAPLVGWGVLAAALAALGLVVARFARGVTPDAVSPEGGAGRRRRTAADWRREAEAHEREGEWRLALRCRYRALVADLAGRGVVDEVPGRTAGEYRAQVADAAPGVAGEFAGATALFEVAWYGKGPTGPEEAARIRSLSERVLAGTRP